MPSDKKKKIKKPAEAAAEKAKKSPMFAQKEPGVSDAARVVYSEEPNRLDG